MHPSSYKAMTLFVNRNLDSQQELKILDVGSRDINGSYRQLFKNPKWSYHGLDISAGKNVNIVVGDPYNWNLADDSYDVVISGQTLEHVEYFWLTMQEIKRVLKPEGLYCIIAPWISDEHRFPVDCWRFLPDGFKALAKYTGLETLHALRNEIDCVLVAKKPL